MRDPLVLQLEDGRRLILEDVTPELEDLVELEVEDLVELEPGPGVVPDRNR